MNTKNPTSLVQCPGATRSGEYERNGVRVSGAPCGYLAPSPTLGQHTDEVLSGVLSLGDAEIARLREAGAIQ